MVWCSGTWNPWFLYIFRFSLWAPLKWSSVMLHRLVCWVYSDDWEECIDFIWKVTEFSLGGSRSHPEIEDNTFFSNDVKKIQYTTLCQNLGVHNLSYLLLLLLPFVHVSVKYLGVWPTLKNISIFQSLVLEISQQYFQYRQTLYAGKCGCWIFQHFKTPVKLS
jgi:hypothetical protein